MAKSGVMHIIKKSERRKQCIIVKHKLPIVAGDFMSLTASSQMLIVMCYCRMYTISTHDHDVLVV